MSPGALTTAVGLSKLNPGKAATVVYWCGSRGSASVEFATRVNSAARIRCLAADSTRQTARNVNKGSRPIVVRSAIETLLEYLEIPFLAGKGKPCLADEPRSARRLIHVFREIDNHRDIAALPSQTRAAAAAGDWRSKFSTSGDGCDHIAAITRNYYANRNLAVI